SLPAILRILRTGTASTAKLGSVSASSKTMSFLSRLAIAIAVLSALALIGILVFYFQGIAIPPLLMLCARFGLPTAFILAAVVIFGNVARRRSN
ncbi:hypothetical protein, partial [Glutamicibacter arilaitensis]|uniref:hypothetical protein n=1 Tax=Glutamicibacter arilaitensis TaxID=256701 RepID=UPI003FD18E21